MMTNLQEVLAQRLTEAVTQKLEPLTRRDIRLPGIPDKAIAVIGMRRAGKTTFLRQCLADRLEAGRPRESLVLLGLEDDRLAGMTAADLDWLLEEYFRRYPGLRGEGQVTLCLDEIQTVPGWERFARRVMDTEPIELFLSGSSAKLLSRELATALRGRAMEVLVHPFSFREALRHAGGKPDGPWTVLDAAARSLLDHQLRQYLAVGGFPEAQGTEQRDRAQLLKGYVDTTVLRDVIERNAVSNPLALGWMQRHLLGASASTFSISKFFKDMTSQGLKVGKNTVYEYLEYLGDSFLIRTVWMHTASERQRMVNPRKVYPVDPGLISIYDRTGEPQLGRRLETAVFLELERRGYEIGYLKTREEWEVDFHARAHDGSTLLIQVCADTTRSPTLEREVRSLQSAVEEHPGARQMLVTLDSTPPPALPDGVEWWPASRWLLTDGDAS